MQGRSKPKNFSSVACRCFGGQRVEVGDLGLAEDVQPVGGEAAGIAGQGEPRARDLGVGHLAVQPEVAGQRLELERIAAAADEVAEPEHQPVLGSRARASDGAGALAFSSWRRSFSSARSSARAVIVALAAGHEQLAA